MATELETFLASEAGDNTPTPQPTPAPTPTPTPEPAEKPTEPPPGKEAKQADQEPDDAEPPSALDGEPVIPRRAYEDERRKRQDWKEKAARAEGERDALRRQLEEAQRPQQPPPQPVYRAPPPDPNTDPQGYQQYAQQVEMEREVNRNLNYSEWLLRDKLGDEVVSGLQQEFKQMAEADRSLFEKMSSQPHPYRWMQQQVEKHRAMREIGDNPAEYKTRIEAEARARWEAEARTPAAPVSPAAGMQPSLATARSVAGRTTPGWTGEPSLDDVVSSNPEQEADERDGGAEVLVVTGELAV